MSIKTNIFLLFLLLQTGCVSTPRQEQPVTPPVTATSSPVTVPTTPAPTPDPHPALSTNLKNDEKVLLFPTNARFDNKLQKWVIPVHGWVFEPEANSTWRKAMIKTFEKIIGVEKNTPEENIFKTRTRMFLVDNERAKNIVVAINGKQFAAPTTGANGHFQFNAQLQQTHCNQWLAVNVITRQHDQRHFSGQVQCVNTSGISVISDIDDTIKDSNVLDKKVLMKNTFLREFKPVAGMAKLYQHWATQGHNFHYVSSSPWQLYPFLQKFLLDKQFPMGSMHLKLVRLKDKSLFNLFNSPEEGKIPTITRLLKQYPERQFILVGDSGEKDPEIYAEIARRYPGRILQIFIRDIRKDGQRLASIFKGINDNKWFTFNDANEILTKPGLLTYNK